MLFSDQNTWEPEEHLSKCKDILQDFLKTNGSKNKKKLVDSSKDSKKSVPKKRKMSCPVREDTISTEELSSPKGSDIPGHENSTANVVPNSLVPPSSAFNFSSSVRTSSFSSSVSADRPFSSVSTSTEISQSLPFGLGNWVCFKIIVNDQIGWVYFDLNTLSQDMDSDEVYVS